MVHPLVIIAFVVAAITVVLQRYLFQANKQKANQNQKKSNGMMMMKMRFSDKITPMPVEFDWTKQDPEKYRPMKDAIYRMTMGLKNLDYDDYILFDKNYLERTNIRIKLVEELPQETILYNPIAESAVKEYYDFVINFYLTRYPMIFEASSSSSSDIIYNRARNDETLPRTSKDQDPNELLKVLARHMEDDFLILLKDENKGEYVLRAGTSCFPNGFNPADNLNRHLSIIHQPVPQYESKLKLAMNKFFDRVQPYQFVYRVNWGIQTHTNLFALTGNHGRPQQFEKIAKLDANEVDFNKVFLRSERQVLTRLPMSKATVLSLKTYVTPLTKIRQESCANVLIGAIEKLPEDIAEYKNKPKWGDAVIEYLQGKTNGVTDLIEEHKFTT